VEIDDLKNAWLALANSQNNNYPTDDNSLLKMARSRSQNIISKMIRSIYLEIGLSLATVLGVTLMIVVTPDYRLVRLLCLLCLAFILALTPIIAIPMYRFYQKLKKFEDTQEALLPHIKHYVEVIENYIKAYTQLNVVLCFLSFFVIFFGLRYFEDSGYLGTRLPISWLFTGLLALGAGLLSVPFVKWYVQKLYGNYLNYLKSELNNLESVQ
jgi:hypothetical protein